MTEHPTTAVPSAHIKHPVENAKLGMWLFLVTEIMFFSGLIGALLHFKAQNSPDANEVLNIPVTAVNTFILIVSSTAVVKALEAIAQARKRAAKNYLLLTLLLGATFLSIQIIEYNELIHKGFTLNVNTFSMAFYTVTGTHGLHVFIGVLWLVIMLLRTPEFTPRDYGRVEVFGLYWHFVDIVWIILFTVIYLI